MGGEDEHGLLVEARRAGRCRPHEVRGRGTRRRGAPRPATPRRSRSASWLASSAGSPLSRGHREHERGEHRLLGVAEALEHRGGHRVLGRRRRAGCRRARTAGRWTGRARTGRPGDASPAVASSGSARSSTPAASRKRHERTEPSRSRSRSRVVAAPIPPGPRGRPAEPVEELARRRRGVDHAGRVERDHQGVVDPVARPRGRWCRPRRASHPRASGTSSRLGSVLVDRR